MKPYRNSDINSIYEQLIARAFKYDNAKQYSRALKYIEAAAFWAYNFNCFYTDSRAEQLLKSVSQQNIKKKKINNGNNNKCVFLDSWCLSNRGLGQQYLRAMIFNGMEILYITVADNLEGGGDLLYELKEYKGSRIISFENCQLSRLEKAEKIRDLIVDFSPRHIFLQILPWETAILIACCSIEGAYIYNINLTDHAYWLGASSIDFNLEFRPYGVTVSQEKRGINPDQQLILPYYPVTPITKDFEGFPPLPNDAVKVFTGGALYKMLGGNDIFFRIMDAILEISPKVYILVAGFEKSEVFDMKCKGMRHGDRAIQLGVRPDIDAVFDHIDIFLGTYPTSGALMNQYAAKHGKPIIAYCEPYDAENRIEELVNHYQNSFRTYSTLPELVDYAEKLINDDCFRKKEGNVLRDGMMTEERFNTEFLEIIKTQRTTKKLEKVNIDYDAFAKRYLDLENTNGFSATYGLIDFLRLDVLKIKGARTQFAKPLFTTLTKKIITRIYK